MFRSILLAGGLAGCWVLSLCGTAAVAGDQTADSPWTRHTIQAGGSSFNGADGVRGRDIDNDGDTDFVVGAEESGITRLYVNPGTAGAKGVWQQRTVGTTPNVEDTMLVDLDGDGQSDVISSTEGTSRRLIVQWAPADGDYMNGTWEQANVPTSVVPSTQWMFAEKLGDHLVVGGKNSSEIGILTPRATSRDLDSWTYERIADAGWTMSILTRDMDGDGDEDVLLSDRRGGGTQHGVHWLENGDNWTSHAVLTRDEDMMFIAVGDLDQDGYDDIVAPHFDTANGNTSTLSLLFGDGSGIRWGQVDVEWPVNFGQAKAAYIADINGDGKKDIVLTAENADGLSGVVWLEYMDNPRNSVWLRHEISGTEGGKFDLAQLLDLDGDGDLDVVTTDEGATGHGLGLVWYENPIPEPATMSLLAIGGLGVLIRRRK